MPRNVELSTLELIITREAMQKYYNKAFVKATEYEAEQAANKDKSYNVPLIHPRVIADAAEQVLESVNKALTAEAKFPKSYGAANVKA